MKRWNKMYLKQSKVMLPEGNGSLPAPILASALKNIHSLGFTFSSELLQAIQLLAIEEFLPWYQDLLSLLEERVGSHVTYKPFYPNFPEEVMDEEESQLYINAILHYWFGIRPDTIKIERPPFAEKHELRVLSLGTFSGFLSTIKERIAANSSLSQDYKEDISEVLTNYEYYYELLPSEFPYHENKAVVLSTLVKYRDVSFNLIAPYIQTCTDVLRLIVAYSEGDVSLATPTKFQRIPRKLRRLFLSCIEKCGDSREDMVRHREMWKRVAKELHPFQYKKRYPKACAAFHVVVNDMRIHTYRSEVEALLNEGDITKAAQVLASRPGEYGRRLDQFLRRGDIEEILSQYSAIATQISTPVLLQIHSHFQNRVEQKPMRVFFPKGNIANVFARENTLPLLSENVCGRVVEITEEALCTHFKSLPSLGKVYVDPNLKQYLVPFSQRSASKSLRTLVRGSVERIANGHTLRFFLYWSEGIVDGKKTGRVDIDLSAVLYGDDWNYMTHIDYTALKSNLFQGAHSGDITSAPKGACEFIDLDIQSIRDCGGRYVVMNVFSFTGHLFAELPVCFAGWMLRSKPQSGEIFDPRSVIDRLDLTSNSTISIPIIFDLKENKMIWADIELKQYPMYANNVDGNEKGIVLMGKALTSLVKPHLYDLFVLHGKARGILVDEQEDADTVFSVEAETMLQHDIIMSEYME
ncbi:TerD family protein [Bacillus cereus]|uniref:TerD family protein n=1 Tax=Bacillus cereus TaxID=1396 RepID=UPI00356CB80B